MQKNLIRYPSQVLIAALNEEKGIGPTITEFSAIMKTRFLVVDGNSHDGTANIAKNLGAKVLFQDGTGKGDAIMKGLKHLDQKAKYVVLTDADYTYPANSVPQMIRILEDNPDVGMVIGNRFSGNIEEEAFWGSFPTGNRLLAFAHKLFNGIFLTDPLTGLRVIRARILKKWKIKSKGFDMEVELNSEVRKQGFATIEIPIGYRARLGDKKLKVMDGLNILKRILLESAHAIVKSS